MSSWWWQSISLLCISKQLKAAQAAPQTSMFAYFYRKHFMGRLVNRLPCHTNAQMLWHIGVHIYALAVSPWQRFAWGVGSFQHAVVDKLLCHTLSTSVLWHIGVHTYSPNCQPSRWSDAAHTKLSYCTVLCAIWYVHCALCSAVQCSFAGDRSVDQMQWQGARALVDNIF